MTPGNPRGDTGNERLQKVLARLGYGSRRICDDLIADGRVRVNGKSAELGVRVDVLHDEVVVDGIPVPVSPALVHYLVNKPAGVICTASDPQGRPTVVSLVPDDTRVFSVGRLDVDTEGLIVLTNDGTLAQCLTHPSHGIEKEYLVEVSGEVSPAALRALREGIELDDGPTAPAKVGLMGEGLLRIVIHEGRNRQVRRMCTTVGLGVVRLVRTRIGPIRVGTLSPGEWRTLSIGEVRKLFSAAGTDVPAGGR